GCEPAVERGQRRRVPLLRVLLPPVVARLVPEGGQVRDRQLDALQVGLGRAAPAGDVAVERPQPRAVAVELELPPLLRRVGPVQGETAGEQLLRRDALAA